MQKEKERNRKGKKKRETERKRRKERSGKTQVTLGYCLYISACLRHCTLFFLAQAKGKLVVEMTHPVSIMEIHELLDIFISHSLNEPRVYCCDSHQQTQARKKKKKEERARRGIQMNIIDYCMGPITKNEYKIL